MSTRLDPGLHREIAEYGGADVDACMNCGNCTAVCNLSTEENPFPRRFMHYLQIGNREKLLSSPDPWLCYYCGECTESCPRDANPAETMMATRRYLTARYDWTGISRILYVSTAAELAAIAIVGLFVVGLFVFLHGPMITDRVALNVFAPNHVIELADLIMLAVLSFFLLSNAYRMSRAVMKNGPGAQEASGKGVLFGIPLSVYLKEGKEFILQFFTQKSFGACGTRSQRIQWIVHLLMMTGYSIVFLLVVVGIRWFQRDEIYAIWNPIRLLGYYSTFGILYGVTYAFIGRIKKSKTVYEHSHSTDWAFLIMLWLTAFTGILIHFTRLLGMPLSTYYIYVIHLMIAVPMLVIEVPFAKWTHQLYRPLILYLMKVKESAARVEA